MAERRRAGEEEGGALASSQLVGRRKKALSQENDIPMFVSSRYILVGYVMACFVFAVSWE